MSVNHVRHRFAVHFIWSLSSLRFFLEPSILTDGQYLLLSSWAQFYGAAAVEEYLVYDSVGFITWAAAAEACPWPFIGFSFYNLAPCVIDLVFNPKYPFKKAPFDDNMLLSSSGLLNSN